MENPKVKMCVWAFIGGGIIAVITQAILQVFLLFVADFMMAVRFTLFTHAAIGSILAATGIYGKIEEKTGMGAIIPLSGLASAVTGCIIGERAEGKTAGQAIKDGRKVPLSILGMALAIGLAGAVIMYFVG